MNLDQTRRAWTDPIFTASDVCAVSGIKFQALEKYIQRGVLFTEGKYQTTKGKARKFSLGDLCQARAMGFFLRVYEMSPNMSRALSWGYTNHMQMMASLTLQGKKYDETPLVVAFPYGSDAYGVGIPVEAVVKELDDNIYEPPFGAVCITPKQLFESVVAPCLRYCYINMEARRDDAQTTPGT